MKWLKTIPSKAWKPLENGIGPWILVRNRPWAFAASSKADTSQAALNGLGNGWGRRCDFCRSWRWWLALFLRPRPTLDICGQPLQIVFVSRKIHRFVDMLVFCWYCSRFSHAIIAARRRGCHYFTRGNDIRWLWRLLWGILDVVFGTLVIFLDGLLISCLPGKRGPLGPWGRGNVCPWWAFHGAVTAKKISL